MAIEFSPFVEAKNRTFSEMAEIELINGPYEELAGDETLADISSNIGLSGDARAVLILTASEKAAIQLTKTITMKEVPANDRLVTDTFGELLNVLVGAAQRYANVKFDFSIPMAVAGKGHRIRSLLSIEGKSQRVISKMGGEEIGLYLIEGSQT